MTIKITPELLDEIESAIEPDPQTGVTRMTYLYSEMSDEFHETNTVDMILALVQDVRHKNEIITRQAEIIKRFESDDEDTAS